MRQLFARVRWVLLARGHARFDVLLARGHARFDVLLARGTARFDVLLACGTARFDLRGPAVALGVWLSAITAHGHAPQTRNVALTRDAAAIAISLPGFGIVHRAQPSQPFVYVCDALLGIHPADVVPSLAFLDDGSLLLGSADGLRSVAKDGCPLTVSNDLSDVPVVALALAPSARQTVYAVVSGSKAGLWRSNDAGQHWELRAPLTTTAGVSALVVDTTDPERVYLSETTSLGTVIRASSNGGTTLTTHPQDVALTLLYARTGTDVRLWAMARDALSVGNRGRAILRADSPQGPWQTQLHVAYFGGFVIDAQSVITVGDEIGGVYRSDDDGQTFHILPSDVSVACLAHAGDALWACTPGTLTEPALQTMRASESFASVVALTDVARLVTCAPELNVERVCAAAWVEWQRDVLRLPLQTPDAGAPPIASDAGDREDASLADAGVEPMPEVDAGDPSLVPGPPTTHESSGCSALAGNHAAETHHGILGLCFALCARCARRGGRPRNVLPAA